jgi:hypothetical protein
MMYAEIEQVAVSSGRDQPCVPPDGLVLFKTPGSLIVFQNVCRQQTQLPLPRRVITVSLFQ